MFEEMMGRLVNGAVWGVGVGLATSVIKGERPAVRPAVKAVMKAYIGASERIRATTAETRENLEDLYAEAKTEHATGEAPAAEHVASVESPDTTTSAHDEVTAATTLRAPRGRSKSTETV